MIQLSKGIELLIIQNSFSVHFLTDRTPAGNAVGKSRDAYTSGIAAQADRVYHMEEGKLTIRHHL